MVNMNLFCFDFNSWLYETKPTLTLHLFKKRRRYCWVDATGKGESKNAWKSQEEDSWEVLCTATTRKGDTDKISTTITCFRSVIPFKCVGFFFHSDHLLHVCYIMWTGRGMCGHFWFWDGQPFLPASPWCGAQQPARSRHAGTHLLWTRGHTES